MIISTIIIYFLLFKPQPIPVFVSPCPQSGCFFTENRPKPVAKTPLKALERAIVGKASYYSVEGCLGCNASRKMANGEILDDTKFTMAQNELKLNTMVTVTNKRNGKCARAKVTDRGGFGKYNRVADLSLALKNELDLKTDRDDLEIIPD